MSSSPAEVAFLSKVDSSKLEEKLGNTDYTVDHVLKMFHKNCEEFSSNLNGNKVEKVDIEEIGQGKGYCSQIFKITIHYPENGSSDATCVFIAKVSSDDQFTELKEDLNEEELTKNKQHVIQMHNCECAVYELFKQFKNFPAPRAYYTEQADNLCGGIILMEDVSVKGDSASVFESVTPEQCEEVARIMASFHTQLNFVKDQSWRKKFTYNAQATHNVDNVINGLLEQALQFEDDDLTDQVKTYLGMNLPKLAKFAMIEYTGRYDCNTLCHADVWTNNMLMKYNEDGSVSNKIASIIDWQIACVGNPLYDVCSFVVLCANADVRRECENQVIDHYYDELCKNYAKHDSKPNFSREQAHEFYKVAFTQLVVSLIMNCAVHALPLKDSKDPKEQEKCKTLLKRLRAAFEDVRPTLDKYDVVEKFTQKE